MTGCVVIIVGNDGVGIALALALARRRVGFTIPHGSIPINRLMPVPLPLRDIIAESLVSPCAISVSDADVFSFQAGFFGGWGGEEEGAGVG